MKFTYHDILNFEAEYGDEFVFEDSPGGELFVNNDVFRESVLKELFSITTYIDIVDKIVDIDDLFIKAEEYFEEETPEEINEIIKKAFAHAIEELGLEEIVLDMIDPFYD